MLSTKSLVIALLASALVAPVHASDTLKTDGAYPCNDLQSVITVSEFQFTFDKQSNNVTYTLEAFSQANVDVIGKLQ